MSISYNIFSVYFLQYSLESISYNIFLTIYSPEYVYFLQYIL